MTRQGQIIVAVKQAAEHPYAWPGGYPLYIVMSDGESLCCTCAKKELGRIAQSTASKDHDGWQAEGTCVNWEDPDLYCCHCNEKIASAYGEDQTMTQHKTTDYEITDYGINNADYFQGHGTSFTKYEHCALGCGDSYSEALDDALEQAAMMEWDIELEAEDLPENWEGKGPSVSEMTEQDEDMNGACMLYYYVGLRWN